MTDQTPISTRAIRHDGWTGERKTRFLDGLAHVGSVRAACASVRMSREAAYRLRRRDPLFALGWDMALVLARQVGEEELACRALHGVEEDVWHRGEVVGTRRKYDSRLLLAHMARLDKLAETLGPGLELGQFDEVLAVLGGEPVPAGIECDEAGMPLASDGQLWIAHQEATDDFAEAWIANHPPSAPVDYEALDAGEADAHDAREMEQDRVYSEGLGEARLNARVTTIAQCEAWREQAHAAADRLLGASLACEEVAGVEIGTVYTPSDLSTSSGEQPAAEAPPAPSDELSEAPAAVADAVPEREPRYEDFPPSPTSWRDFCEARKRWHQAQLDARH